MSQCAKCGAEFISNQTRGRLRKYCLECSPPAGTHSRPRQRQRPEHNVQRQYTCVVCGSTFTAGKKAKYCSSVCHYKHVHPYVARVCSTCGRTMPRGAVNCPACFVPRQKARFKIAESRRKYIYERDNWTCQICGDPVDLTDDARSGLFYPTLDHIIPRSLGGGHESANLRCAHRHCNSSRGDGTRALSESAA